MIRLFFTKLGAATALGLLLAVAAPAQITFNFTYSDATGVGFNDPVQGTARKAALVDAANTFASYFAPGAPVTLEYEITSASGKSYAASGASLTKENNFAVNGSVNGNYNLVQLKVITPDNYPATANIPPKQPNMTDWRTYNGAIVFDLSQSYDLKSVAMHELMHTFGVATQLWSPGSNDGYYAWTSYDFFLSNSAGDRLINGDRNSASFASWNGLDAALTGGADANDVFLTGGVYFAGANAVAANGGNLVPIYSPATWQDGSSFVHTSDNYFTGTDALLMNAYTSGAQTLSPIEVGMLADLGYTMAASAVPEPETYALWAGLAGLGVVIFRRRRAA